MNLTADTTETALASALEKCGGGLERVGPGRWRLAMMNGRPFAVSATVDSAREWLCLDADAGPCADRARLWSALMLNGRLGGFAKVGLVSSGLRLRAEVPLERRDVAAARIAASCAAFKDALAALDTCTDTASGETVSAAPGPPGAAADLAAQCRESGWNVAERTNGTFAVHLDCARRFYQALVAPQGSGGVLIFAELMRRDLSAAARAGLATLFLTTNALVRLARAAAEEEGGRASLRLEVAFDTSPDASDLHHALSALAAGCSLAGDEARVLQHEVVATRYLALRTLRQTRPTPAPVLDDAWGLCGRIATSANGGSR